MTPLEIALAEVQRRLLVRVAEVGLAEAAAILDAAIADMIRRDAELRAMDPDNGWGDYDGFLHYLQNVRDACKDHPLGTMAVNW